MGDRYQALWGTIAKRDVGGWFSTDVRLYVGRRDCTKLVSAMVTQVAAVRKVLDGEWAHVPVRPMLCFVEATWSRFAKPMEIDGVVIAWPRAAVGLLRRAGIYTGGDVQCIAAKLKAAR